MTDPTPEQSNQPAYRGRVKYDTVAAAQKYQKQKPDKHAAEMRLVKRAFAVIPKGRVLDVPCGGGRVSLLLASDGYEMTAADLALPMLDIAREHFSKAGLDIPALHEDVEKLSFANGSFDAAVCFRLFHHFPNAEIRKRAVSELCRVARTHVALSYFSPYSFTSLKRRLSAAMGGKKSAKYPTSLDEVTRYFDACDFTLDCDFARLPLIHTLHLAVFRRRDSYFSKEP